MVKATFFESIITFIIEEEESQKGLSLVVREFNKLDIYMLPEYGISGNVNTTRFAAKLIESLPNLHSNHRIAGKTIVMFDSKYIIRSETLSKPQTSSALHCEQ